MTTLTSFKNGKPKSHEVSTDLTEIKMSAEEVQAALGVTEKLSKRLGEWQNKIGMLNLDKVLDNIEDMRAKTVSPTKNIKPH